MKNVKIIIKHYTEDLKVFFDREKKEMAINVLTDDYTCNLSIEEGIHFFQLKKENATLKKHWKREVLFHWISALFTVPDFSLDTVGTGAYQADCYYQIEVKDNCEIVVDVRYKDIEVKSSNCKCIELEKKIIIDKVSLKKIRKAYIIPFSIVVGSLCVAFLVLAFMSFFHRNILAGSVVTGIALLIGGVYIYCMKKFFR